MIRRSKPRTAWCGGERDSNNSHMITALRSLAMSQVSTGAPALALESFNRALALSGLCGHVRASGLRSRTGSPPSQTLRLGFTLTHPLVSRRVDAARRVCEALASARALGHVHTLPRARVFSRHCGLQSQRGRALALSAETIDFAGRHELEMWKGYGSIIHAHAQSLSGDGGSDSRDGKWVCVAGENPDRPGSVHHAVHACALASLHRFDEAGRYASMVRTELESGSERHYWPECQRLLGDYLACAREASDVGASLSQRTVARTRATREDLGVLCRDQSGAAVGGPGQGRAGRRTDRDVLRRICRRTRPAGLEGSRDAARTASIPREIGMNASTMAHSRAPFNRIILREIHLPFFPAKRNSRRAR